MDDAPLNAEVQALSATRRCEASFAILFRLSRFMPLDAWDRPRLVPCCTKLCTGATGSKTSPWVWGLSSALRTAVPLLPPWLVVLALLACLLLLAVSYEEMSRFRHSLLWLQSPSFRSCKPRQKLRLIIC